MKKGKNITGSGNFPVFFAISLLVVLVACVFASRLYIHMTKPRILEEMNLRNQATQFRLKDFVDADIPYIENGISLYENTRAVTGNEPESVFTDYFDRDVLGYRYAYLYDKRHAAIHILYDDESSELPPYLIKRLSLCDSPYPNFMKNRDGRLSYYLSLPDYQDWVFYCTLSERQFGILRDRLGAVKSEGISWCILTDDGVVVAASPSSGFMDIDLDAEIDAGVAGRMPLRELLAKKSAWSFSGNYAGEWLASFFRMTGSNLVFGSLVKKSMISGGIYKPILFLLFGFGTIFYFAFILGWRDSIRIRQPVERITDEAERFVKSELFDSGDDSSFLDQLGFKTKHASLLERLEYVFKAMTKELQELHYRRIRTNIHMLNLNEINRLIHTSDDFREALVNVTGYVSENLGFPVLGFALIDRSAGTLEGRIACRKLEEQFFFSLPFGTPDSELLETIRRAKARRLGLLKKGALLGRDIPVPEEMTDPTLSYMIIPIKDRQEFIPCRDQIRCNETDCPAFKRQEEPCYLQEGVTCRHTGLPENVQGLERCINCDLFPVLGVALVGYRAETRQFKLDYLALETFISQIGVLVRNERLFRDLQMEEEFRKNIMESMSSGLVSVDLSGVIININRLGSEILGKKPDECMGMKLEDCMHPADGAPNPILDTLENNKYYLRHELTIDREEGQTVILNVNTSLLRDEQGKVYGAVGELNNITNLRKMEEELRQLEKLAALGRFTTSVAHEIRNPLGGIGTGIQYLRKSLPESQRNMETFDFIEREIARLDRIIVDLYKISRPSPLMLMKTSIWKSIDWAARSLEGEFREKHVKFVKEGERNLPDVEIDVDKIEQVLINLFKNALQASPEGAEVKVSVRPVRKHPPPTGSSTEYSHLRVTVEDHGEGITKEDLPKVFEPFFSKKEGGTGLGLFISYSIIERHGGEILVESEEGEGTRFFMDLPISLQTAEVVR